jgi:hypothetical protein
MLSSRSKGGSSIVWASPAQSGLREVMTMSPDTLVGKNGWTASGLSAASKTSSQRRNGVPVLRASRTAGTAVGASALPGSPSWRASSVNPALIWVAWAASSHQTRS